MNNTVEKALKALDKAIIEKSLGVNSITGIAARFSKCDPMVQRDLDRALRAHLEGIYRKLEDVYPYL